MAAVIVILIGLCLVLFVAWWRAVDRMHWAEAQLFAYRKTYGPANLTITRREA